MHTVYINSPLPTHPRSEREVERPPQKVNADSHSNQAGAARIAQLETKLEQANDKFSQLEKQVSAVKLVLLWSPCKQATLYKVSGPIACVSACVSRPLLYYTVSHY